MSFVGILEHSRTGYRPPTHALLVLDRKLLCAKLNRKQPLLRWMLKPQKIQTRRPPVVPLFRVLFAGSSRATPLKHPAPDFHMPENRRNIIQPVGRPPISLRFPPITQGATRPAPWASVSKASPPRPGRRICQTGDARASPWWST